MSYSIEPSCILLSFEQLVTEKTINRRVIRRRRVFLIGEINLFFNIGRIYKISFNKRI